MNPLRTLIADRIRANGPISVAEYMSLALYHPSHGYYARASCRTGRAGDFFTSVDIGPVFGELLARQFAEMQQIVREPEAQSAEPGARRPTPEAHSLAESRIPGPESRSFDLAEAAAGSGRLARDILDAAARHHPELYDTVRLHLIETAPAARTAQIETLGPHASKLVSSSASLPESITGVIFANELLDALPTHAVVMREDGLREIFVDVRNEASPRTDQSRPHTIGESSVPGPGEHHQVELVEREREPSTRDLGRYLDRAGVRLEPGWRAEINLEASAWIRQAARSLRRGFLMLIDYGHEAADLYSATHSAGTLATFRQHTHGDRGSLLQDPGECDMTAHVDLTTLARTAEAEGLVTLGRLDQTYFLLGLGLAEMIEAPQPFDAHGEAGLKPRPYEIVELKRP